MALQVWLPLNNGTLKQQGLNSVAASGTAFTVDNGGKLGKCIKTTTAGAIDLGYNGNQVNSGSISFGGWFKFNQSEISSAISGKTYTSSATSATGNLIGNNSYGGVSLQWNSNNMYSGGSFSAITVQSYLRSSTNGARATSSFTLPFDIWTHIFLTYDKPGNLLGLWINGELKYTSTQVAFTDAVSRNLMINYAAIAGGNGPSAAIPFLVNDVRVYDNCLSATQIKEIAKGLVLHYPLTNKYIESTTNLITTEDCLSATCYNGAISKYSYGTNTDMYKTVTTYEGRKGTKVYMGTNGNACFPYVYVNNMYTSDGTNSPAYKTLSFDYYGTIGNYLGPYPLGSGTGTATYKVLCEGVETTGTYSGYGFFPVTPNKWNHIEVTFHGTTAADSQWGYIRIGNGNHTSNTSNFWFFANMQLETKDHATGYAGVGGVRNSNIVYDCSGFGYNGTLMTDTTVISNDITKYHVTTHFNGTYDGILIENLQLSDIINSAVTYAFWIKPESESGARSVYFGSYSTGPSWSIEKTAGNVMRSYWNGSPDETCSGATITDGVWQHVCMVKEGTNSIKVYINGEQKWQSTAAHSNLSFPTTFRIGRDTRSNDGTPYKGLMSDFRIYATALSANDIKSLYQNKAYIDASGNVYGQIR